MTWKLVSNTMKEGDVGERKRGRQKEHWLSWPPFQSLIPSLPLSVLIRSKSLSRSHTTEGAGVRSWIPEGVYHRDHPGDGYHSHNLLTEREQGTMPLGAFIFWQVRGSHWVIASTLHGLSEMIIDDCTQERSHSGGVGQTHSKQGRLVLVPSPQTPWWLLHCFCFCFLPSETSFKDAS